jgi:hypothetical protein
MKLCIYFPYATTDSFPLILLGCGRLQIEQGFALSGRDTQPFNREDVPRQAGSRRSSQTLARRKSYSPFRKGS